MIDASKGFEKDGPKNRLRPRDMHKIVDAFVKQKEIERYSRMVPLSEIADPKNDYNLNIPRYIDSSEPEDIQDLHAHLQGGIPNRDLDALQPYWDAFPSLRAEPVQAAARGLLRAGRRQGRHPGDGHRRRREYQALRAGHRRHRRRLVGRPPRKLLVDITSTTRADRPDRTTSREALLEALPSAPADRRVRRLRAADELLERLDARRRRPDHGRGLGRRREAAPGPHLEGQEQQDQVRGRPHRDRQPRANAKRWVMDLIPPEYVVARFFPEEKAELDELVVEQEAASQAVEEYVEEHAVEEGLLWEAVEDEQDHQGARHGAPARAKARGR